MMNEGYLGQPDIIDTTLLLEEHGPQFVRDLANIKKFVKENGQRGTFVNTIYARDENNVGFEFSYRNFTQSIHIMEWGQPEDLSKEPTLKTRIIYDGPTHQIYLGLNTDLHDAEFIRRLSDYGIRGRTHLKDYPTIQERWIREFGDSKFIGGNIDTLRPISVSFIENFLSRSQSALLEL